MARTIEVVEHELSWAAAFGYRVRGECLDAEVPGTPGRFYFSKDSGGVRTCHVHACAEGHPQIADLLAVRDFLRAHSECAAQYGALKRDLAACYRYDNVSYMRGKDAFVKALIEVARGWVGWSPVSSCND
jgi:GrpB-like predicted nucleotidyltransferase (UPF0157 family)